MLEGCNCQVNILQFTLEVVCYTKQRGNGCSRNLSGEREIGTRGELCFQCVGFSVDWI